MQGQIINGLYVASGGSGARLVVLLHGMGATGAVWHGVTRIVQSRGWRWIAPDLRGHGRSLSDGPFSLGNHAADIADLLAQEDPAQVTLLGHSFGAVVAGLLAGGLFGPVPSRLLALAAKTDWGAEEIASITALALRPARLFPTKAQAQERYMRFSGLAGLIAPDAPEAEGGTRPVPGGHVLAMNPRVLLATGTADVSTILAAARCPLHMAAGSADAMASPDSMRRLDPAARFLPGLPHNAHVADPVQVAALLD